MDRCSRFGGVTEKDNPVTPTRPTPDRQQTDLESRMAKNMPVWNRFGGVGLAV